MFKVRRKRDGKEYIVYHVREKTFQFLIYQDYGGGGKWTYIDINEFEPY